MEQIFKIVAIGILACVMGVAVKKENPVGTLLVSLAAAAVILLFTMKVLEPVKAFLDQLSDAAGLSPAILSPLYKTLAIAILTKTTAEACEDAKEKAFGIYVEVAGAVLALYVSLPLLSAVFSWIRSCME